ncbi:MAG: beta-N-acetylhexosaminidase [Niabella sp.]
MRAVVFYILLLLFTPTAVKAQNACPIIPQPQEATVVSETFLLNKHTPVLVEDESLQPVASYLQQQLLAQHKIPLSIQAKAAAPFIQLSLVKKGNSEEAYQLVMNAKQVHITGANSRAVFYGVISLLQLASGSKSSADNLLLHCWNITDAPLLVWRGLMLDESRHFFGMEKVKSILNWMAFYKLNRFHWHLTDEPAWRIEIKKYPRLTLVGGIGSYTDPDRPAQFYTQQQIAEVVRYAAERNITVIPEIDMPGHATAANMAYPAFSGGGSEKHPEFTFHPGKEGTYGYLTDILREVNALFPSNMLHLGGDEVSFGNDKWMADTDVKSLMTRNKLTTVQEVEQYFMQRMADSVYRMNAKLLAWDEVANMNFPTDKTIVFWWRHDRQQQLATALNKGYSTVLCPRLPFYFDFVQDSTHTVGRKWGKAYSPLKDVYDFNIMRLPGVTPGNKKQVLGVQANVWTETMTNSYQLDFMLYPRIAALAETAWSSEEKKNYALFTHHLKQHFTLYKKEGINYFDPFKQ